MNNKTIDKQDLIETIKSLIQVNCCGNKILTKIHGNLNYGTKGSVIVTNCKLCPACKLREFLTALEDNDIVTIK